MKKKPVVLVVMDGVGITDTVEGNAVKQAHTPNLDALMAECPNIELKAHGLAVGLPSDEDMGNSEVGHNALGSGQIFSQGAKLVNGSIADGSLFESKAWKLLTTDLKNNTLHLLGLLSDGNVHSHVDHVIAMIKRAKADGVKHLALHALQDGRDVEQQSALTYIDAVEAVMNELNDDSFHAEIASGGGRMLVTMDRYDADWGMVERGWKTHVLGDAQKFASATEAINHFRAEEPTLSDQYIPAWVVAKDGEAVAPIVDNDSVIFFNFRGDRALEISKTFEGDASFDKFDRVRVPNVKYAGMLQYDGDSGIPANFLVEPPHITDTLTETLIENGMSSFAISETQKYGHVTYFWNGNKLEKFDDALETYVEIKGDDVTFDQRPWMKSAEITDEVIAALNGGQYDFIRLNFPNGDMVGHTGDMLASIISVEAVDLALGRLLPVVKKNDATLIVLADHGNADEMVDKKGNAKTSHTLNPVPFIIYNRDVELKQEGGFGLANVAATVADLLDIKPNAKWETSLIKK
ncbi:2,3-bisphosphoglycerate-independent phosphoglycerate mutase [Erysipelothrix sp. HDW6C]|uniref:2,3-bisphosphoglycerate-independent phosphoglycerate mutase n=1 Tax=Erysipelothrix sp. HDW6C TaxID=2714930 RepID=UPI00140D7E72|nr:2,3-bisphosphoglycerate-independent phosphoglycerate mutase [Erysipelothrix sp. HDW6C]QIK70480.1 2,3-bisphosphoglycerate-independent phosphoglycerate mutase [Erysipelothrix sp. HDW6C]